MPFKPKELDLSVGLIAYNEENNLARCLESLPAGAELVLVLDVKSSDRTREIAESFGCKIYEHPFTNFSEQKNLALSHCTRSWALMIDCDEELDLKLQDSIVNTVNTNRDESYTISRKLFFQGKMMRYGKTSDHPLRLFKRGHGAYTNTIHEVVKADHPTKSLDGNLIHYSYADLDDYFDRFNRYTAMIAKEHRRKGTKLPSAPSHFLRPFFEFIQRYFFRLGFLDGRAGYVYALVSSFYAFVKYEKYIELMNKERSH